METQALQQNVEDNAADAGGDAISDAGNADNTVLDNEADTAALDNTVTVTDNAASGNADVESNAAVGKLITQDSVNLRSLPSAESEILTKINQNTELSYFERSENSDGEGWYQVVYNDMTGYVIESAVTLVQESAEEAQTTVETVEVKEEASREETQSESEADDSARAEFEVSETGTAQKSRSGGGIDMVLVLLIAGGILCIAAIIVFLRKILALLRE
ncbi:MAG: SH3 domain-containing protein [Lachnospiraceae bacterium]|nr:SH3 domain-containing protein [Lachnospiraceae bacterium]